MALVGFLMQERQERTRTLGVHSAEKADGRTNASQTLPAYKVPPQKRIVRGMVTLNAAWMCAVADRMNYSTTTQVFSRSELTGICAALWDSERSQRIVTTLQAQAALQRVFLPLTSRSPVSVSSPDDADSDDPGRGAVPAPDRTPLYTIGDNARFEIDGLLSACKLLGVNAYLILDPHLTDVKNYMRGHNPGTHHRVARVD